MIFQLQFVVPNDKLILISKDQIPYAGKVWSIDRVKDDKGFTKFFIAYINTQSMASVCKMELSLKRDQIDYHLRFLKDRK